jgi:FemAB-related protein (PEP-CTERM system-associated)
VSTIAIATEAQAVEWDRFVVAHSAASGYHMWGWRDVFHNAFGHESIYLSARDGGEIVGILPLVHIDSRLFGRSLTSLPFLNYGGVVADCDEVAEALVASAGEVARQRRCPHVELRHVDRRIARLPVKQHKVAMILRLVPAVWDSLDRKVRNQVRKAQKSGLTVDVGGLDLVDDFYAVFTRNMRDLGTPVYGRQLFEEVLRTFPERTALHVVRLEGRPVAAGLTYRTNGTVEVPWASSVRDYNSLCPNHLLYWSVIERALEQGCDTLDFGRSTPGEGTFKFKEQWGAQPVALHWEYELLDGAAVPNVSPSNPKYRLMIEAWKRLPVPVATILGPRIVRCIA